VIRIDTSGCSDDDWVGVLFPVRTPVSARLARYVHEFDTVELNASFYRWPNDSRFAGWRQRLQQGLSRRIAASPSSVACSRASRGWVERFERSWRLLGDRVEMQLRLQTGGCVIMFCVTGVRHCSSYDLFLLLDVSSGYAADVTITGTLAARATAWLTEPKCFSGVRRGGGYPARPIARSWILR